MQHMVWDGGGCLLVMLIGSFCCCRTCTVTCGCHWVGYSSWVLPGLCSSTDRGFDVPRALDSPGRWHPQRGQAVSTLELWWGALPAPTPPCSLGERSSCQTNVFTSFPPALQPACHPRQLASPGWALIAAFASNWNPKLPLWIKLVLKKKQLP